MKKILSLIALSSVSLVSADPYTGGYSSYPNDGRYYQDSNTGYYYQQSGEYQPSQGTYYQRDSQNYSNDGRYYQNSSNTYYQPQGTYYQRDNQNIQNNQQQMSRNNQQSGNNTYYAVQNDNNGKMISDQEISKKIHESLSSGWFSKGFKNISYEVSGGNVTLKGTVDTLENKNKVEDSVRKIDGVRQINNQITVNKEVSDNYSDSQLQKSEKKYPQDFASNAQDRQINAKIRDKLSGWFSKDYETLILKTTNGVVIISGTVDKPEDIQKINDQIKKLDGVKSVNNQVTVKKK